MVSRGEENGVIEIDGFKIKGGNVMHEPQNEERKHMWSPPSQRSSVGNPADQRVFNKVATCYSYKLRPSIRMVR